ncbi:integrase [Amycolatopsis bartoniae]|uniref:Site-specific integrase n=1 Tax=Amycolatopsis bartoniae TaxID=941986 RepID=A0A8H9IZB6_9PSEU|nr:tyrosine-type recombinase/integrase [Amycolatopsis bartoniae]MBB2935681.1 integrase [Amycolatopsis bartoniae]TVT02309.1 tyrosine-type recombinase/integrase [Amycolatopsis bartoniae]GHF61087.1 site-specific integrase [Amycolatopsis bartoniae]
MTKRAANGMGTIVQRKDGRYHAAVYVLAVDGTRERKYVYGKTWEEANEKRIELLDNNRKGLPSISSSMKLSDYLDYWLDNVVQVERGPSTYSGYEVVIRRFIKPKLGSKKLNALTPADVRKFLAQLRKAKTVHGKDLSARYVQNIFEVLRGALNNAVREELIGRNVTTLVKAPSRDHFEVRPMSETDARRFLRYVATHWLYALWLVLITTGLRKGEVLGLAWSDINLMTGEVRVRRTVQRVRGRLIFGQPKTKRSRREVYLPEVCLVALRAHRTSTAERMSVHQNPAPGQPDDLVFITRTGRVIEPRNVNTMLDRVLKNAKIDRNRVHDLRHTCATLLLLDGATIREVMELLGHASISTTADIYGHVLDEAKRRLAQQMNRLAEN